MSFIAIDLDGTLLNDQNEISEENIKAIQYAQDRGFEVVISTGRAYFDVQTICEKSRDFPICYRDKWRNHSFKKRKVHFFYYDN
ncbi:HAD hydrolase family protein [Peribacillus frigoritolerans]|nr:HAD hydrolase family protein [Peribacillus frigoritolerans]